MSICPILMKHYFIVQMQNVRIEYDNIDYFNYLILIVIRSVSDVLRAQSRFVKFVRVETAGQTPYTFYKPTLGPKYVSNRPYNEFITPTTFI